MPSPHAKVLIFTITRANPQRLGKCVDTLTHGHTRAGYAHDWVIYTNSPETHTEFADAGEPFTRLGTGENVGQHVALRDILAWAQQQPTPYDFLVRVDDDIEFLTDRWLKKLVRVAQAIHTFSGKWVILAPEVRGLLNPIPVATRLKLRGKIPLCVTAILGGAVRLHHRSFFETYPVDVRRAMGAGDATSVTIHANKIEVGLMYTPYVRVRHDTRRHFEECPDYFTEHLVFQHIPYIPQYTPPPMPTLSGAYSG